jgi:hypothetical protein
MKLPHATLGGLSPLTKAAIAALIATTPLHMAVMPANSLEMPSPLEGLFQSGPALTQEQQAEAAAAAAAKAEASAAKAEAAAAMKAASQERHVEQPRNSDHVVKDRVCGLLVAIVPP